MWRNRLYQTLLKMVTLAAFLSHVGACMWWAVGHSEGMGASARVPPLLSLPLLSLCLPSSTNSETLPANRYVSVGAFRRPGF